MKFIDYKTSIETCIGFYLLELNHLLKEKIEEDFRLTVEFSIEEDRLTSQASVDFKVETGGCGVAWNYYEVDWDSAMGDCEDLGKLSLKLAEESANEIVRDFENFKKGVL